MVKSFERLIGPDSKSLEFARKPKPTGKKKERRKDKKLPNQIRHDQNAGIAVGTWKRSREKKDNK